jgi:hypothetical protein
VTALSLRRLAGLVALIAATVAVPLGAAQRTPDCSDVDSGPCDLSVSATSTLLPPDHVRVDVTVSNIGESQSFETPLTVTGGGDWSPFKATVDPLPPDGSQDFSPEFPIPESARGRQAVFRVEVVPLIGEGENGPNVTRTTIDIPPSEEKPPPDLMPEAVTGRVIGGGARVEITGSVRNLGGATGEAITVTASAPGWEDKQVVLEGGIEGKASVPITIVLETPDEQRGASVRFHIDVTPLETEERTDNNTSDTEPVQIPGGGEGEKPDLVMGSGKARVVEAGQRVRIVGSIENRGKTTLDDLRVTVSAAGWDEASTSLSGGLQKGKRRTFRFLLTPPKEARGGRVAFLVGVDPVADEENVANNADNTEPILLPLVASTAGGRDLWWPLLIGGAAALVAAAIVSWQFVRRLRVRQRHVWLGSKPGTLRLGGEKPVHLPRSERVVNTGFSSESGAGTPLSPDLPLAPMTAYLFWLEVGPLVAGSIEETPTDVPAGLPAGATLTVAIFSIDESLTVAPDGDLGELRLEVDGKVVVTRAAARDVAVPPGSGLDLRRLFFRVRTGDRPGTARLRCSIYYGRVLLQARLITAGVRTTSEAVDGALSAKVDYTLAPSLDPARLAQLEPHRLSVFVNESADGSHDFYFLGEQGFKNSASFDGQELQNLITRARGALKCAAWGDSDEWADDKAYRYEGFDLERLELDLIRFALSGYRFYDAIINRLAGGHETVAPLATMMLQPGLVQIASRESPRHVIPAALIYDYPLDTTAPIDEYELCATVVDALVKQQPLADTPCFRGECPNRTAATVVCPSGFWGYRHALGMPVSVASTAPDLPGEIAYADGPHLVVAVSTDPAFVLRARHEQTLRAMRSGLGWQYADTREQALALLKAGHAEIVYFYCHGGVLEDIPFIQVGSLAERGITRDLLRREAIRWSSPRPLVFINGCHTTALEPEKAIEFVSALIENAQASGVIGTEITVFEPLASAFAEECLRRFLDGEPLGAAVRNARLALLAEGNPLGLAYIPFAMASLRLRASQASADG